MAIPLQPSHPGLVGYPWGAAPNPASTPEELDLGKLWISQTASTGTGAPPDLVTAGLPSFGIASSQAPLWNATQPHFNPLQGGRGYYMDSGQPHPGKRLVLNHNKAITKKLASAVHFQQVLDCVADSVQYFDEVNVATALHRLAKLQPPSHTGQASPVIYAAQFQQLVGAVRKLLDRFEAQAVSNTMWAFATLSYFPEDSLLEDLANQAVSIMSTFKPQATSNTLWAFAKLSYCPNKALLHASAAQMLHDLPNSVPQDISNTLWAFATLRHYPGKELMEAAATQAVRTIQNFKPQEIANTLWSFATLGHDPKAKLLDAMAFQMVARVQHFRPQAVSNSLWAYAKLGYNPGKLLMEVSAQKAMGMLHQYTSQELANTLWALATLQHHPGASMLEVAAVQIARRIEQFTPQDTANSIWAFAKLFHYPCEELLKGMALYLVRHWARFKASEVATVIYSLALLRACSQQTWQIIFSRLASVAPSSFDDPSLRLLLQAYLLVDAAASLSGLPSVRHSFPQPLLDSAQQAWQTGLQSNGKLSALHQQVSETLWNLGVLHSNHHLTPDGLFSLDIFIEGTNVAIDIQEASAFAANNKTLLGETLARRILWETRGYNVIGLPCLHWNLLETDDQRRQYLSSLLASVSRLGVSQSFAATQSTGLPLLATRPSSTGELPLPMSAPQLRLPSTFGFEPHT